MTIVQLVRTTVSGAVNSGSSPDGHAEGVPPSGMVESSSYVRRNSPIAQLVEQVAVNYLVGSSSLPGRASL